jgi:nicotinamide mononucleotide transporter
LLLEIWQEISSKLTPVEIWAVITSIAYAWLAARNSIWCWLFGVVSPILSGYALYFYFSLYAETLLQLFYIGIALYGAYSWKYGGKNKDEKPISQWNPRKHLWIVLGGTVLAFAMGKILADYTDAASTYLDAFTTVFAVFATIMTARRVLENWIYWMIIDSVSIYLYASRGGYLFAALFLAYTLVALYGYYNWKKTYRKRYA